MSKTNTIISTEYVGKILYEIRKSMKITKQDMAGRIGITARKLGQYENGICIIPTKILKKLLTNGISTHHHCHCEHSKAIQQ